MRYRAAKTIDVSASTTLRDVVPTKLAAGIWNCVSKYKSSIVDFPQTETCELLIVDRSIDQVCLESLQSLLDYNNNPINFLQMQHRPHLSYLHRTPKIFWRMERLVPGHFYFAFVHITSFSKYQLTYF